MSSIPVKIRISDNVAISQEAVAVNESIKADIKFSKEQGYPPLRTNNKRALMEYLMLGKADAQYNQIRHHSYLDLRAGKAT